MESICRMIIRREFWVLIVSIAVVALAQAQSSECGIGVPSNRIIATTAGTTIYWPCNRAG